jgi:hypothetical protein
VSERAKRVFISYAWDSVEHRQWVRRLAARLCRDGVNARLDAWHLRGTDPIPHFMSREVREADRILVICTPGYQQKVQVSEDGGRTSGVDWEALLVTSRLLTGEENKTLAVLARGTWKEAAPDFVRSLPYSDLSVSDPALFEANYRALLEEIKGTAEQAPPVGGVFDVQLSFTLEASAAEAGGWGVSLQIEDGAPVRAPFELDLAPERQTGLDLQAIARNTCTAADIGNLGSELWSKLLGGPIKEEVERVRRQCRDQDGILKLRLLLPPELEEFPWEAIFDYDEGALGTSPQTSVVRSPTARVPGASQRHQAGPPLKMLVVIPAGSGLRTASEWERIRQTTEAAGDRVILESLDGPVTLERFERKLREGWNIVHFIGHGRLREGKAELRLNREGEGETAAESEAWIPARLFAQQFRGQPTELVVMNCCHGGSLDAKALSSLSDFLARVEVPAILAMRYGIHDSAASEFSAAFYRELFAGKLPGRIDLAVQGGRATLERQYPEGDRVRSMITPVLYLAAGCEKPFDLPPFVPEEEEKEENRPRLEIVRTGQPVDRRLLSAIESRCCLPILGPGLLAAGAERQPQAIPPSPGGLAQQLARLSEFPGFERLTPLADSEADWLTPVLFERICQHFESVAPGERRALNEEIRSAYRPFMAHTALDQIASWDVPGVVYTYVDGLLEKSLQRLPARGLRIVQAEDLEGAATADGGLVLLNLRGSYMAPSMVLTEEDEDRLLDRMQLIADFVANLMNRSDGCTLLFLGVSARDPLVRALARRLLRDDVAKRRGTAFFVSDHTTQADQAYWYQFNKLEWLDLDADRVIDELTQAARKAPRTEDGGS